MQLESFTTFNLAILVLAFPGDTAEAKWQFIQAGLSRFAGRELTLNEAVYESKTAANQRNHGIVSLLQSDDRIYFDPV